MFIGKREFDKLIKRVEALEKGENTVVTLEYGEKSLKFYIRLLCGQLKKDPSSILRSFED